MKTSEHNVWFVFVYLLLRACTRSFVLSLSLSLTIAWLYFIVFPFIYSVRLFVLVPGLLSLFTLAVLYLLVFICGTLFKLLNFLLLLKLMFVSFLPFLSLFFLLLLRGRVVYIWLREREKEKDSILPLFVYFCISNIFSMLCWRFCCL